VFSYKIKILVRNQLFARQIVVAAFVLVIPQKWIFTDYGHQI